MRKLFPPKIGQLVEIGKEKSPRKTKETKTKVFCKNRNQKKKLLGRKGKSGKGGAQ